MSGNTNPENDQYQKYLDDIECLIQSRITDCRNLGTTWTQKDKEAAQKVKNVINAMGKNKSKAGATNREADAEDKAGRGN